MIDDILATLVATTTTDQNGNFNFPGLSVGSYTLDFQRPSGSNFVPQWWNNRPNNSVADYFALADGQALVAINVAINATLAAGATLSGSISGAGSPSVPLAAATAFPQDPQGLFFGSGSTDSNGNFTITEIPAGIYSLSSRHRTVRETTSSSGGTTNQSRSE